MVFPISNLSFSCADLVSPSGLHLKLLHSFLQLGGQDGQGLGCRGNLLTGGGLFLGGRRDSLSMVGSGSANFVDILHGGHNAVRAFGYCLDGPVNIGDLLFDISHHGDNLMELDADLVDGGRTFLHLTGAAFHGNNGCFGISLNSFDPNLDFFRSLSALLGQLANFFCYHRETAARISGPGCLNSRIQSKEIRLIGNGGYCLYDLTNLLGVFSQLLHYLAEDMTLFQCRPSGLQRPA